MATWVLVIQLFSTAGAPPIIVYNMGMNRFLSFLQQLVDQPGHRGLTAGVLVLQLAHPTETHPAVLINQIDRRWVAGKLHLPPGRGKQKAPARELGNGPTGGSLSRLQT